jgi:hypothetical protein
MRWHVHYKNVADAPAGAQARVSFRDGAEDLVRMQAALHQ